MSTPLRRVSSAVAAAAWTGRAAAPSTVRQQTLLSGPAAPSIPPRFYGDAGRAMSLRGLATRSSAGGRAGQRASSADAEVQPPGGTSSHFFQVTWDSTIAWIRHNALKYSKFFKDFKDADESVQIAVRVGSYIYLATASGISGIMYYVDRRVDTKVESKVGEECKKREEFERQAVRDFQDHVSKTQNSISKLHDKVLDNQEKAMNHRHEIMTATKFLELHGYLVLSTDEYAALEHKVSDIEKRTALTTQVISVDEFTALLNKVDVMQNLIASSTEKFPSNGDAGPEITTGLVVNTQIASPQVTSKDRFSGSEVVDQEAPKGSVGMAEVLEKLGGAAGTSNGYGAEAAGVPPGQGTGGAAA